MAAVLTASSSASSSETKTRTILEKIKQVMPLATTKFEWVYDKTADKLDVPIDIEIVDNALFVKVSDKASKHMPSLIVAACELQRPIKVSPDRRQSRHWVENWFLSEFERRDDTQLATLRQWELLGTDFTKSLAYQYLDMKFGKTKIYTSASGPNGASPRDEKYVPMPVLTFESLEMPQSEQSGFATQQPAVTTRCTRKRLIISGPFMHGLFGCNNAVKVSIAKGRYEDGWAKVHIPYDMWKLVAEFDDAGEHILYSRGFLLSMQAGGTMYSKTDDIGQRELTVVIKPGKDGNGLPSSTVIYPVDADDLSLATHIDFRTIIKTFVRE